MTSSFSFFKQTFYMLMIITQKRHMVSGSHRKPNQNADVKSSIFRHLNFK